MSSPAKKRKLNRDSKTAAVSSRSLEYYFARQRDGNASVAAPANPNERPDRDDQETTGTAKTKTSKRTDEELARKLQAEWDEELADERAGTQNGTGKVPADQPASSPAVVVAITATESSSEASLVQAFPSSPKPPSVTPSAPSTLSLQSHSARDDVTGSIPLDENPLSFDPGAYLPALEQQWAAEGGGRASYALMARCFVLVNGTQSRIKIVDTLVNCVRLLIEGDPDSLLPAVWLATNSISPPYVSLELGLGGSAISRALRLACGLSSQALKAIYDRHGDAGDVAFEAKKKLSFTLRKPKPLTVQGVYDSLVKIAGCRGQGSGEAKQRIVDRLLRDARGGEESRYIVRTLCQHLRIGAVKTTMLIALSRAALLSKPADAPPSRPHRPASSLASLKKEDLADLYHRAEETVKACFARRPNYDDLVPLLLSLGVCDELLRACDLTLHVPLRPMLGSITRDLAEMLERLKGREFACEWKYDGQRAQVHRDAAGKVSLFSRHLELMTDKYPDLVALVSESCGDGVESFVLEGEVVAVEKGTGALKSFQTLTNRARKDVELAAVKVDVCLFAFDLMFLNGTPLLDRPFRERRKLLRMRFAEVPGRFARVRSLDAVSGDSDAVLEFFKQATENKCEGIMVKILDHAEESAGTALASDDETNGRVPDKTPQQQLDKKMAVSKSRRKQLLATYEPDKRLESWLKVKKDYTASHETVDLVPVAAWHGQGRKARWWSPILLAVRNERAGTLEAVCKCISGFTDVFYKEIRAFYDDIGGADSDDSGDSGESGTGGHDGPGNGGETAKSPPRNRSQNVSRRRPGGVVYAGPEPDVWFQPREVWEIAYADITLSPTYVAAREAIGGDRGLSLRFPRFLRKRTDKAVEDASTDEFLAQLWEKQEARGQESKDSVAASVENGDGGDLDDDEL